MGFGIGVSSPGMGPRGALDQFSTGEDRGGQVYDQRVIVRLLAYLRPYSWQMSLAFLAMLAVSALTLLTPYLLKVAVDQYISQGDQSGLMRISLWTAACFCRSLFFHCQRAISAFLGRATCPGESAQHAFYPSTTTFA